MKITSKEIRTAYVKAVRIHKKYLAIHKVKLPKWKTAKGYWLAILLHAEGKYVHKDDISKIIRNMFLPKAATDQQVRHLSRDGWNVEGLEDGHHRIKDSHQPHPGFARETHRRQTLLTAEDFNKIKEAFGKKCATCGAEEGKPDLRYLGSADNVVVKLQKGHRDPAKPLSSKNTIPQCQNCNRAYKDDFTFDKKGRVRAVANAKPVQRASKVVQEQIRKMLEKKK